MTGLSLSRIVQRSDRFFPRPQILKVVIKILFDRSPMTFIVSGRSVLDSASSITSSYPPTLSMAQNIVRLFVTQMFLLTKRSAASCRPATGPSLLWHHIPEAHQGVAALWPPSDFPSSIGPPGLC